MITNLFHSESDENQFIWDVKLILKNPWISYADLDVRNDMARQNVKMVSLSQLKNELLQKGWTRVSCMDEDTFVKLGFGKIYIYKEGTKVVMRTYILNFPHILDYDNKGNKLH